MPELTAPPAHVRSSLPQRCADHLPDLERAPVLVGEPWMVQQVFSGHIHLDDQTVDAWKMVACCAHFRAYRLARTAGLGRSASAVRKSRLHEVKIP
ncbi:hypothetical protein [Streptomyces sp. NPDC088730]|uniref:hypothetical protein n=1 Tax=Streptomyces sp. NPDC088730 TaxID=3365877 RepID=UPI0038219E97